MLARRIEPPQPPRRPGPRETAEQRAEGRWRAQQHVPTRGPHGPVRWWQRPAPRGDTLLWEAVQRAQARRLQRGVSVQALAQDLARSGHPIRRETLSRVLNGKQRTSWRTAEALAVVLGVDLDDLLTQRFGVGDDDDGGSVVPLDP